MHAFVGRFFCFSRWAGFIHRARVGWVGVVMASSDLVCRVVLANDRKPWVLLVSEQLVAARARCPHRQAGRLLSAPSVSARSIDGRR